MNAIIEAVKQIHDFGVILVKAHILKDVEAQVILAHMLLNVM